MARARGRSRSRSRRRKGQRSSSSSSATARRSKNQARKPSSSGKEKKSSGNANGNGSSQRTAGDRRKTKKAGNSSASSSSQPRKLRAKVKSPKGRGGTPAESKRVEKAAEAIPSSAPAAKQSEQPSEEAPKPNGGAKKASLGDLAELQKQLQQERGVLEVSVLKAKREAEEKKESQDKREKREKEYYKASFGEPVGPSNRFLVEEELGKGAFSSVYRCKDTQGGGKDYAVKFIRANQMLRKATEKEVKLMRRLRTQASEQDPEGASNFLALAGPEMFEHEGHLALVFPLQRCDLRDGLQKYGQGHGLPLLLVRGFARNIFLALRALRRINVIHSDLKPDNLLMSVDKGSVKLSDFGSAMDISERIKTDFVQPRYYRSPEVILGQSYGPQIDIWSAGATLFELACGRFLFTGATNNGMIHDMLKVCGAFPRKVATSGDFAARHFTADGDFRQEAAAAGGAETLLPMSTFPKELSSCKTVLQSLETSLKTPPTGVDAAVHQALIRQLADLIGRCVDVRQAERIIPDQALEHKFLQKGALTVAATKPA